MMERAFFIGKVSGSSMRGCSVQENQLKTRVTLLIVMINIMREYNDRKILLKMFEKIENRKLKYFSF